MWNEHLYDERIDAMKARERNARDAWVRSVDVAYTNLMTQEPRNIKRLAAYKRKRRVSMQGNTMLVKTGKQTIVIGP